MKNFFARIRIAGHAALAAGLISLCFVGLSLGVVGCGKASDNGQCTSAFQSDYQRVQETTVHRKVFAAKKENAAFHRAAVAACDRFFERFSGVQCQGRSAMSQVVKTFSSEDLKAQCAETKAKFATIPAN